MRRNVSYALCKLPFEEVVPNRGCDAKYVGHPFFDELVSRGVIVYRAMQNGKGP